MSLIPGEATTKGPIWPKNTNEEQLSEGLGLGLPKNFDENEFFWPNKGFLRFPPFGKKMLGERFLEKWGLLPT